MRKVHIDLLCDWHFQVRDEEVEAVAEFTIVLDKSKPKVIGVCEDCRNEWFQNLEAAVERAQSADDQPRKPRERRLLADPSGKASSAKLDCPWPWCDRVGNAGFNGRTALGMHFSRTHKTKLLAWENMDDQQRQERVAAIIAA